MSHFADIDFLSASPGPPPPVCSACGLPMHYDYTLRDWDCFRCRWLNTPAPDDEPGAMTPEAREIPARCPSSRSTVTTPSEAVA